MSIVSAIVRILQQWDELKTHFEIARRDERCFTAQLLYEMFSDKKNYVFLIFLKHILGEVQSVNKKFESEVQDPTKLLNDLVSLVDSITAKNIIPGRKLKEGESLQNHLDPHPYLGYEFEKEMQHCKIPQEREIRERCIQFVVELAEQLRQRLPDNVKVQKKMSLLSVNECLNQIKPGILELAQMFVTNEEILTRIDFQWKKIHYMSWNQTSNTLDLWAEIASYRDASGENTFCDLSDLALTILSLPHSNANVERVFSHMNIVKSKLRTRLNLKSLNAILTIRYGLRRHGSSCHTYKLPQEVLKKIGTLRAYEATTQQPGSSKDEATLYSEEEIGDWELADLE
ncbi:hypothetical protein Pmani_004732 [Petrolisthes manimaculis]|uniref:HAT C-terminal dimerisation domain-containing protein n=1 Tax=Petrolisthes manimaculis TaxID=1843537 RepID=A0AAE1UN08_9EUCA|nr:hypothetical protein Pmani_004732 [Petrolisthes manimaculis]